MYIAYIYQRAYQGDILEYVRDNWFIFLQVILSEWHTGLCVRDKWLFSYKLAYQGYILDYVWEK